MLRVAGQIRDRAFLQMFDFLDTGLSNPEKSAASRKSDQWGRGKIPFEQIKTPSVFLPFKRKFKRYGTPRKFFREFLDQNPAFNLAMIQTTMTYWYPGVQEVIEDIRSSSPECRIVLGGNYATICSSHAKGLGPDLVVAGNRLEDLWKFIGINGDPSQVPFWEAYQASESRVGVIRLTDGCPFRCTYCSVPSVGPKFLVRASDQVIEELSLMHKAGIQNVAFYDDALLFQSDRILIPFLERLQAEGIRFHGFHTPNALNARFLTGEAARKMADAGFKTFFLGFESKEDSWQKNTGGKVSSLEFVNAIENLIAAGVSPDQITCYLLLGHPCSQLQRVEDSMRFANQLGIRVMLSEFSPIPGTPDGEKCRKWIDLDEPLNHNKTFFTRKILGEDRVQRIKDLCIELNRDIQNSRLF